MTAHKILSIAHYEFTMLRRVARTGLAAFIVALIAGALGALAIPLLSAPADLRQIAGPTLELPVEGWQNLPSDMPVVFRAHGLELVEAHGDVHALVAAARLCCALELSQPIPGGAGRIQLLSNAAFGYGRSTQMALERIRLALDDYRVHSAHDQLVSAGIDAHTIQLLQPQVRLITPSHTPEQKGTRYVIGLVLLIALVWACNAAALSIAEESERETLESLLLACADQMQIMIGKSLSVAFGAVLTLACGLAGVGLAGATYGFLRQAGPPLSLPACLTIFALSIPLCLSFSTLLVVASYQRRYQSALTQASLLSLLLFSVTSAGLLLKPPTPAFYLLPGYGTLAVVQDILAQHYALTPVVLAVLGSLALCGAAVLVFRALMPTPQALVYGGDLS